MELDQILKLIDAGFTKTDIEAMTSPAKDSEPVQTEPAEPVKAEPAEPVKTEPVKAEPIEDPTVKALLDEVKSLRKQLQLQAIVNDGFTPAADDSAEKILASIINPAQK